MIVDWTKESWRNYKAEQQPLWPDHSQKQQTLSELSGLPALVFAGESRTLLSELKSVSRGESILLQGGECSEEFSGCNGSRIHNFLRVVLQMAIIISYSSSKKVVKIGRIAGQYAKPRSSLTEVVNGIELPTYRGDMVNGFSPTLEDRIPNPKRMIEGYFRSAATLNLIRAFTKAGYASIHEIGDWQKHDFSDNPVMVKYSKLADEISRALDFTKAVSLSDLPQLSETVLYTSHEGLLLDYEESMTRIDTTTGGWYDTSAHMLWIGDRTRQLDGAHVEFMSGVKNPIGIKIGPSIRVEELDAILNKLNPENIEGRITLINRFGADKVADHLPAIIRYLKKAGRNVIWCCDPMHGNTYKVGKHKTRKFESILSEIGQFWSICKSEGVYPGGVHLELTGENVTECIGGMAGVSETNIHHNYQTNVDPRLNAVQGVELAFELADILKR